MSKPKIAELFEALAEHSREPEVVWDRDKADEQVLILKGLFDIYSEKFDFKVGDIIEYKDGMKVTQFPKYGEPVIVKEVLSSPAQNTEKDIGSVYYAETYDIVIATTTSDGDFHFFTTNSNRFKPYGE